MLDNRAISDKQKNPNNSRAEELLEKRFLKQYQDETNSSILGFNKLMYHPEKLVGVKNRTNVFPITATLSVGNYCIVFKFVVHMVFSHHKCGRIFQKLTPCVRYF